MIEYQEIPQPTLVRWKVDRKNREIVAVAKKQQAKGEAQKALEKALRKLQAKLKEIVGVLSPGDFWMEMERFQKHIKTYKVNLKRSNWSEQACDEMFRDACVEAGQKRVENLEDDVENQFGACVQVCRFVWRYEAIVSLVSDRAFEAEAFKDMGDDSFGDACDSFPLFGEETVNNGVLKGVWPKDPSQGENYIVMHLNEAMMKWLALCCRDLLREELGDAE